MAINGRLSVGRLEELDEGVSWVRLQLGPDMVRGIGATELAGYLHSH